MTLSAEQTARLLAVSTALPARRWQTLPVYRELGANFLDRRHADQVKHYLLKRLERLGLVVPIQSMESTSALPT